MTDLTTAAVPSEQFGRGSGVVHVLSTDAALRLQVAPHVVAMLARKR